MAPQSMPSVTAKSSFSGYIRGFGNTVIIHHGFEYYTVTSRIEKILVKKGQKVKQGQSIGVTGDTATLLMKDSIFRFAMAVSRWTLYPGSTPTS